MRVLLVNDLAPGPGSGVEVHLGRLAEALERGGDEVEFVAAPSSTARLGKLLDLWNPGARRHLERVVRAWHPDVVHFHNVGRELSAAVLGAGHGVPRLMTFHDHRLLGAPDVAHQPAIRARLITAKCHLDRWIARRDLDAAVALSDATSVLLERYGFATHERHELFAPIPPEPDALAGECHDIVFAGRLAPDKGALTLAMAFAAIADDHPAFRLVFVGEGPDRSDIEAVAATLPGRVLLLGSVSEAEVCRLMSRARVVAAPSVQVLRPETGPQTVIEAAMLARPVVTTKGVPMAQLILAAGCGRVVEPGSAHALAGALGELCGDGALASRMGSAARAHARANHSPEVVVPRLQSLYRRLVAERRAEQRVHRIRP